ncbi:ProQ/FINO family protein [Zoogloea sp.]|uniref:ProQ/FINO family protein n=1 Tax=Zoogloea sp. TaxID=49181 RepID=UPI002614EB9F|nr:ProQ/FINO family protein [Zoogloea sp.]MDD3353261.1 ProQ/FINO family protein [Zoogloea sp.]
MQDQASSSVSSPPSPRAVLKTLCQEYPVFKASKPLAIGIDKQLQAQRPELNKKALKVALHLHTKSIAYLKQLQLVDSRFNLDGSPADPITEDQRQRAAESLKELFRSKAEKHRADKAAEEAARAEEEKQRKLRELAEKFGRK